MTLVLVLISIQMPKMRQSMRRMSHMVLSAKLRCSITTSLKLKNWNLLDTLLAWDRSPYFLLFLPSISTEKRFRIFTLCCRQSRKHLIFNILVFSVYVCLKNWTSGRYGFRRETRAPCYCIENYTVVDGFLTTSYKPVIVQSNQCEIK